jgi:hypothetical protein
MASRRYTILVTDRSSGRVRRFTVGLRTAVVVIPCMFILPLFIGVGALLSGQIEREQLQLTNNTLEIENNNYRATTAELTMQIQSLEEVIDELGARSSLDPVQQKAMARLPAIVKARAAGGEAGSTVTANVAVSRDRKSVV